MQNQHKHHTYLSLLNKCIVERAGELVSIFKTQIPVFFWVHFLNIHKSHCPPRWTPGSCPHGPHRARRCRWWQSHSRGWPVSPNHCWRCPRGPCGGSPALSGHGMRNSWCQAWPQPGQPRIVCGALRRCPAWGCPCRGVAARHCHPSGSHPHAPVSWGGQGKREKPSNALARRKTQTNSRTHHLPWAELISGYSLFQAGKSWACWGTLWAATSNSSWHPQNPGQHPLPELLSTQEEQGEHIGKLQSVILLFLLLRFSLLKGNFW